MPEPFVRSSASLPGFCRLRMHSRPAASHNNNYNSNSIMSNSHQHMSTTTTIGPSSPTNCNTSGNSSAPVAFVEFKDAECAAGAMNTLQGTYLLSSDRGPIRIEFAKSKMAIIGETQPPHFVPREVCDERALTTIMSTKILPQPLRPILRSL